MSLAIGDTIRVIKETSGFRDSAMYTAINVKPDSYAVVVEGFSFGYGYASQQAAILRYVKKHKVWKKTKVIITLRAADDLFGSGEGNLWVRTNVLDKLVLA